MNSRVTPPPAGFPAACAVHQVGVASQGNGTRSGVAAPLARVWLPIAGLSSLPPGPVPGTAHDVAAFCSQGKLVAIRHVEPSLPGATSQSEEPGIPHLAGAGRDDGALTSSPNLESIQQPFLLEPLTIPTSTSELHARRWRQLTRRVSRSRRPKHRKENR